MTDETSPTLSPEEREELIAPVRAQESWFRRMLVYLALGVGLLALWFGLSASIALARRTPTLDYMACHDRRQDEAIVHELRTFNHLIADPTADVSARLEAGDKLIDELEEATNPDSGNACPALPLAK